MPVKYSDPSDDLSPSFSSRFARKVSDSLDSFRVRKHAKFKNNDESGHSGSQGSLLDTRSHSRNGDADGQGSLIRLTSLNTDGSHDSRRLVSEGSSVAGINPRRRGRRSQTLETVLEVPSGPTSRATTILNGNQPASKIDVQARSTSEPVGRLHVRHSSACSDMHQSVKSGDYLLARGANPRTGVVTPTHTASSSLEDYATAHAQRRPPRWRQNGDQWISLDLGEPTPMSTTPSERLPEHQYQAFKTPQKHAIDKPRDLPANSSVVQATDLVDLLQKPGVTFQIDPRPGEHGVGDQNHEIATGISDIPQKSRRVTPVKRKPVGSPLSRSVVQVAVHVRDGSGDSTDTVLRRPRFNDDFRSSSAPGPLEATRFSSQMIDKALPRVPQDPFLDEHEATATDKSFLGPRGTGHPVNEPNSEISNISGQQTAEKELPCLPTSNGLSQSKLNSPPYPTSPKKTTHSSVEHHQTVKIEVPQGPREGGDPSYPYIRTARATYPILPTTSRQQPLGERGMPIPVYDNPPKHPSLLVRTTGSKAKGPRFMHPPEMSVPERTRLALSGLLNTTTIPTDIFMNKSALPESLQIGPRPIRADFRTNRGRHGFPQTPHPRSGSDIIMNTAMNMSNDSTISIPMPRIRPRATARPAMPTRAEGMYGIPKTHVGRNRYDTTSMERHGPRPPTAISTVPDLSHPRRETSLVPDLRKSRAHVTHDPTICREIPLEDGEAKSNEPGLMRKCSRCNHGFVGIKLHNIDSIIHTSDLQRDGVEAEKDTRPLTLCRSPLPGLTEGSPARNHGENQVNNSTPTHWKTEDDERDHNVCCPECCKLDCHEGCLGHPSPKSSPISANTMWSERQTPGILSGLSTPTSEIPSFGHAKIENPKEKPKLHDVRPITSNTKILPNKEQESKSGNHIQTALIKARLETAVQPPTPPSSMFYDAARCRADAVAAACSALKPPPAPEKSYGAVSAAFSAIAAAHRKVSAPRPSIHKRQRSNSLPIIGLGLTAHEISGHAETIRAVSGTRLRIPSAMGLVLACSGPGKNGRNVSGTSMNTIDLQIPNLASLTTGGGYTALTEIVFVPLEATKMWIKTHPQILTLGEDIFHRAWEMTQIMTKTAWRLWAVVFVYSKTGKIKFDVSKGETAGGFLMDIARSLLYFLVFAAVSALVVRVLGLVMSVLRVGVWFFKAVFWVVRSILGVGAIK